MFPRGARRGGLAVVAVVAVGLLAVPATQAVVAGSGDLHGAIEKAQDCQATGQVPTVADDPATIDRRLDQLHAAYDDLPGFVDVYFVPGQDPAFRPMFVGDVPAQARQVETSVDVAFDTIPSRPMPAPTAASPDVGDVRCQSIRPGAMLLGGCTINFVYTDGADFFVGTAGHCIQESDEAHIARLGHVGDAVFSTGDGGVGNDFALIQIHEEDEHLVSAEMCDFAGPTATNDGPIFGQAVLQTGHGLGFGFPGAAELPPRPTPGVGLGWGAESFSWVGNSVPGDSGSPARLSGGDALGTVTHIALFAPVLNFGTPWDRGLELASEAGYGNLELVTVDELQPV